MKKGLIYLLFSLLTIAIWQYFGSSNSTVRLLVSYPSLIIHYFSSNYHDLLLATGITALESILGLIIATLFSFGIMIICFYRPKFMDIFLPVMITSQVVPLIVLAPFFIILFGIGLPSKIAMASVISFFPIFVNFAQGYKTINPNILELMNIYNSSTSFKIWRVYFPLSIPNIMAGLKISVTLSVIGAIVAEFSGANAGLGKNLFISALRLEPELMMCSLILSTLIGFIFFYTVKKIEHKLTNWI